MNLDKLKSDIANNEICVLVNGQPETVNYKNWCRCLAYFLWSKKSWLVQEKDIYEAIDRICAGENSDKGIDKVVLFEIDY